MESTIAVKNIFKLKTINNCLRIVMISNAIKSCKRLDTGVNGKPIAVHRRKMGLNHHKIVYN